MDFQPHDTGEHFSKGTTLWTVAFSTFIDIYKAQAIARSFMIDSLQIMSTLYYPGGLPEEKECYISQAIITGQGMPALILTNEYTSRQ